MCARTQPGHRHLINSSKICGAFIADPVGFVDLLLKLSLSRILACVRDLVCNRPINKSVITCTTLTNTQSFIPLLLCAGTDDYANLSALSDSTITPFTGETHSLCLTIQFF